MSLLQIPVNPFDRENQHDRWDGFEFAVMKFKLVNCELMVTPSDACIQQAIRDTALEWDSLIKRLLIAKNAHIANPITANYERCQELFAELEALRAKYLPEGK